MTEENGNEQRKQADEQALEQFLQGESPVSDAYRELEAPEPPAALDRAIIAEARAAVGADSGRRRLADWMHWIKPLSAVAVMGLCVSIVLQVIDTTDFSTTADRQTWDAAKESSAEGHDMAQLVSPPAAQVEAFDALPEDEVALGDAPMLSEPVAAARKQLTAPAEESRRERSRADRLLLKADADAPAAVPERATWEAGISFLVEVGETERAAEEQRKLQLVYPEETDQRAVVAAAQEPGAAPAAVYPDPDVWLAGIAALRERGEIELARIEEGRIRVVYPDVVIPAGSR